jgi:hypothetical protein
LLAVFATTALMVSVSLVASPGALAGTRLLRPVTRVCAARVLRMLRVLASGAGRLAAGYQREQDDEGEQCRDDPARGA